MITRPILLVEDRPDDVERTIRVSGAAARSVPALAVCLALAVGCGPRRADVPVEKLTVALAMLPHAALFHVAVARGFFGEERLDVVVQPHRFGKTAVDALVSGEVDLATAAETPFVLAALGGGRIVALATLSSATKNTGLVGRKASGIASPRDLAGKRIGVPFSTNAEFFLDTLLTYHGVDKGSVRLVDLKPDELPDALARGAVDAVAIWNPYVLDLEKRLGDDVLVHYADDIYLETFAILGGKGIGERRRDAIERLMRALLRAERFVWDHPEDAAKTVAATLKADPADFAAVWACFNYRVRLDQGLLVLFGQEARWALRTGRVPKQDPPNFLDYVEAGPLSAVRPGAVRLIR
ncbi:MAG: NrtA/SsuA/CpmA family ABC transporter substrate-binding protein [Acidobacteriota bacterium]